MTYTDGSALYDESQIQFDFFGSPFFNSISDDRLIPVTPVAPPPAPAAHSKIADLLDYGASGPRPLDSRERLELSQLPEDTPPETLAYLRDLIRQMIYAAPYNQIADAESVDPRTFPGTFFHEVVVNRFGSVGQRPIDDLYQPVQNIGAANAAQAVVLGAGAVVAVAAEAGAVTAADALADQMAVDVFGGGAGAADAVAPLVEAAPDVAVAGSAGGASAATIPVEAGVAPAASAGSVLGGAAGVAPVASVGSMLSGAAASIAQSGVVAAIRGIIAPTPAPVAAVNQSLPGASPGTGADGLALLALGALALKVFVFS